MRVARGEPFDVECCHEPRQPRFILLAARVPVVADAAAQHDVLAHCLPRQQAVVLRHEADAVLLRVRLAACNLHAAALRLHEPRHCPQERRLATA